MSKNAWITAIIIAIVFGGGGYYAGTKVAAQSSTGAKAGGAGGVFVTRGGFTGGAGFAGGATIGTVVQVGSGSFTIELPSSTSTTATTGTKLVLIDNATAVQQLETVPTSNIQVGQTVTVSGTANSDGSVTASSVMIRPAQSRTGSTGATNQ